MILSYKEKRHWFFFYAPGAAAVVRYAGVTMHDNKRNPSPPCSPKYMAKKFLNFSSVSVTKLRWQR